MIYPSCLSHKPLSSLAHTQLSISWAFRVNPHNNSFILKDNLCYVYTTPSFHRPLKRRRFETLLIPFQCKNTGVAFSVCTSEDETFRNNDADTDWVSYNVSCPDFHMHVSCDPLPEGNRPLIQEPRWPPLIQHGQKNHGG